LPHHSFGWGGNEEKGLIFGLRISLVLQNLKARQACPVALFFAFHPASKSGTLVKAFSFR